jgi:hypothetical protein
MTMLINPHRVKGGGGKITPQADLSTAASRPFGIKRRALVTFPTNGWATKWYQIHNHNLQPDSNMAAGTQDFDFEKVGKVSYLV